MRSLRPTLLLVLIVGSLVGQVKYGNADAITANQLRDYLSFIASDELEGRNTPSRGLNTAAKFLATDLSRWGFKPAGDDGTFFQKIRLRHTVTDIAATKVTINGQELTFGRDYYSDYAAGAASGPLVFVGYGYRFTNKNIDDFKNVDVKGKIIVKLSGLPPGATFADFQGKQGVDWDGSISYGARNGALAVVVIADFQTLARWDQGVRNISERGEYDVEQFVAAEEKRIPSITLSASGTRLLLQGESISPDALVKAMVNRDSVAPYTFKPTKTMTITSAVRLREDWTQNVVAIWEGADRRLKNEYVAVGAHYDHVGIGTTVEGDSIYNGADDDGSGTVAVLAMAEALSKGPRPKRSVLFVWHAGEERGLWGSRYYVNNPTVPIKDIVAQLNIDMIGRSKKAGDADPRNKELSGPDEIYVIGSNMMSSALGKLSESVNTSYLKLKFNYTYDDPNDPNRFFFRSDHFNYAQKGIPIIFYFDGEHEDYHGRGDHWEKIDYQKMEKVTRTIYATMWELANAAERPVIDKDLPPELREN